MTDFEMALTALVLILVATLIAYASHVHKQVRDRDWKLAFYQEKYGEKLEEDRRRNTGMPL